MTDWIGVDVSHFTCSIERCSEAVLCKDLCAHHYRSQRKYGDPLRAPKRVPVEGHSVPRANGCIEWVGPLNDFGYGLTRKGQGSSLLAHRVAWERANGPIPAGQVVRHKCDNRPCVNVEHLELGTQADNIADAVERNRVCRGTRHPRSKLTEQQVAQIRESPFTMRRLARDFGVGLTTIHAIKSRKTWSHI